MRKYGYIGNFKIVQLDSYLKNQKLTLILSIYLSMETISTSIIHKRKKFHNTDLVILLATKRLRAYFVLTFQITISLKGSILISMKVNNIRSNPISMDCLYICMTTIYVTTESNY
jgi:hypothetical protein